MTKSRFRALPINSRIYVATITIAGAGILVHSAKEIATGNVPHYWLLLAALTVFSASIPIRLHAIPVALSVSETFVFTSALLFGPAAATLTVAIDAAVISFWSFKRGQAAYKIAFNICALPLTIWLAAHLFFLLGGFGPLFQAEVSLPQLIVPMLACTVAYFLLSSWLITFAIALEKGVGAFAVWYENFAWISLNYFGGASVAALVVSYIDTPSIRSLAIVVALIPLLALLYETYSRRVGHITDANRHLAELNSLYVSTIETLAMAIDAKDQVTHGHIRRVQTYAVGLAQHVGITDSALIRAIEAAALLHDMGKLAIPEYILNKPGPLTPAEFERMKLHAAIGADILSSINFPYPVVPIVRHHHENWDGSGYPDGLIGTNIPIGARILSVVDCYDALTSDRPYRPRLTDEQAIAILLTRRGTMYDPLMVDTFIALRPKLKSPDTTTHETIDTRLRVFDDAGSKSARAPQPPRLGDIAASTEEMLVLYDLAQALTGRVEFLDAADVIAKHLRRIVPASTCVFYLYDDDKDDLVAGHASGEHASYFVGLRIPRGQRLSGWVAATRQSIVNSDPILDLGDAARHLRPPLASCLSTPLVSDTSLIGVLTAYATQTEAFTDDHRRLLEVVAKQVSTTVKSSRMVASVEQARVPGLTDPERFARFVGAELEHGSDSHIAILFLRVQSPGGRPFPSNGSLHVAAAISKVLRGGDVLSNHSDDEFVVALTQTDYLSATVVCSRIVDTVTMVVASLAPGSVPSIGIAAAPDDGTTLEDLVRVAREKAEPPQAGKPRRPAVH
jgi:putative nucleotidyltransferase with HDIG domain